MAHYLIFTKVVTLTLPFIRFSKKKILHCRVVQKTSFVKKIRTIGQAVWPVERFEDRQTYKQTNTQTDRGDQYTLRKSEISQSNESRSKSGTTFRNHYVFFTVRLTLTATCQGERLRVEIIQRNSVKLFKEIIQRNSVRCADFHFS